MYVNVNNIFEVDKSSHKDKNIVYLLTKHTSECVSLLQSMNVILFYLFIFNKLYESV